MYEDFFSCPNSNLYTNTLIKDDFDDNFFDCLSRNEDMDLCYKGIVGESKIDYSVLVTPQEIARPSSDTPYLDYSNNCDARAPITHSNELNLFGTLSDVSVNHENNFRYYLAHDLLFGSEKSLPSKSSSFSGSIPSLAPVLSPNINDSFLHIPQSQYNLECSVNSPKYTEETEKNSITSTYSTPLLTDIDSNFFILNSDNSKAVSSLLLPPPYVSYKSPTRSINTPENYSYSQISNSSPVFFTPLPSPVISPFSYPDSWSSDSKFKSFTDIDLNVDHSSNHSVNQTFNLKKKNSDSIGTSCQSCDIKHSKISDNDGLISLAVKRFDKFDNSGLIGNDIYSLIHRIYSVIMCSSSYIIYSPYFQNCRILLCNFLVFCARFFPKKVLIILFTIRFADRIIATFRNYLESDADLFVGKTELEFWHAITGCLFQLKNNSYTKKCEIDGTTSNSADSSQDKTRQIDDLDGTTILSDLCHSQKHFECLYKITVISGLYYEEMQYQISLLEIFLNDQTKCNHDSDKLLIGQDPPAQKTNCTENFSNNSQGNSGPKDNAITCLIYGNNNSQTHNSHNSNFSDPKNHNVLDGILTCDNLNKDDNDTTNLECVENTIVKNEDNSNQIKKFPNEVRGLPGLDSKDDTCTPSRHVLSIASVHVPNPEVNTKTNSLDSCAYMNLTPDLKSNIDQNLNNKTSDTPLSPSLPSSSYATGDALISSESTGNCNIIPHPTDSYKAKCFDADSSRINAKGNTEDSTNDLFVPIFTSEFKEGSSCSSIEWCYF